MKFKLNKSSTIFVLSFLFLFTIQFKKDKTAETSTKPPIMIKNVKEVKNINKEDSLAKSKITYTSFIFPTKKKDSAMVVFKEKYSEPERYTILALNRLDEKK